MDWRSQFEMFMPHGMCLLWQPELMLLHILSDAVTAIAYFTMPISIFKFVRGRDDLERRHVGLAFLFAAFIALCGLSHVFNILVLWVPVYIIEGWLKALTAIASVATAGWLITHINDVLSLASVKAMQAEIAARRDTENDLRQAQQDLGQSLALLRTVIEVVPGLIFAKDRAGRILLANAATLNLIGRQWPDVMGRTDREFLNNPGQAEIVMANDRSVMAEGNVQELEEILDHPSLGRRIYQSTKVPFDDGDSGGLVGFSIDITDRKRAAKEDLQVARRTAMGDMAAAIAHEINQPLASIAMYLAGSIVLLERAGYEGLVLASLSSAKEQCLRAGEIIRRVRSFVSGGSELLRREKLSLLVDGACSLALLGSRDSGITISIEHDDALASVLVDEVQIEQVIVNLVRNALDAMGEAKGMALTVRTRFDGDGTGVVSVSDTGPGVNPDIVDRLFEPFVSTKGVKGMGVGLSICRTIVENHGGKIWLARNSELGATFCFTLPAFEKGLSE